MSLTGRDTLKDTYRHKGLRKRLIADLQQKGIKDQKTLQAMSEIPRHLFLDLAFEEQAYIDKPFPIGNQQTISQPFTVAYQTQLLQVQPRDKVLEVGTGSGYQAAVLGKLGARVFTLERQQQLFSKTKKLMSQYDFGNIRMYLKDGFSGLAEFAPYDKILVTAGADHFPEELAKQLRIGGTMVIPIGLKTQVMHRYQRISATEFDRETLDQFKFVPMLSGIQP